MLGVFKESCMVGVDEAGGENRRQDQRGDRDQSRGSMSSNFHEN